jgi:hypothetical protein
MQPESGRGRERETEREGGRKRDREMRVLLRGTSLKALFKVSVELLIIALNTLSVF